MFVGLFLTFWINTGRTISDLNLIGLFPTCLSVNGRFPKLGVLTQSPDNYGCEGQIFHQ